VNVQALAQVATPRDNCGSQQSDCIALDPTVMCMTLSLRACSLGRNQRGKALRYEQGEGASEETCISVPPESSSWAMTL
jgi:hypothetical protein